VTPGLVRDVLLFDGSTLRLRAPRAEDLHDIKAFYDRLSPESRYLRFHGYGRTDIAARAYADANGIDRLALIGRHGERMVAGASYDLLREPGVAEVAFAVADDFQKRGAATRMLEQLAAIGAERGVRRFNAEVLAENRPMLAVLERAGFDIRRKGAYGELTVSLDITPSEAVRERIDARDHIAAVASLRSIFAPRSVAVVNGAPAPADLGEAVLSSIRAGGFTGAVEDLERAPELVIVAADSGEVPQIASQAAANGAKALLVLTPGPQDGGAVQDQLLEIVRNGGLRLIGPSSLGVLNTDPQVRLNATFAGAVVSPGHLAICSQSGAIGIGLLGHAAVRGLGISSFVSLGDRTDVSTNDLLELWEEDDRTAAVMLYVETFGNPEHFARIATRVSRRKPILAVKGRRAAEAVRHEGRSHTAAALHGDAVVDALFRQAGVLRFRSGDELFNAAAFFESQPLPLGRRIAVLSNSAGVATLAADACATRRLALASPAADINNPTVLGIRAGPEDYAAALASLLADQGVDAAMVYYVDLFGDGPEPVLDAVSGACAGQGKPVVASILGGDGKLPAGGGDSVPNFVFPEACAAVLGRAVERREWLSRPLGQRPRFDDLDSSAAGALISSALERDGAEGGRWLPLAQAEALLATHGIEIVSSQRCDQVDAALAAAAGLDAPIALKADFPAPAHAGDIDAVLLGLKGDAAVRSGWRELQRRVQGAGRKWMGAIVQPLVSPGADLLVGALRDPDLGVVMGLGLGGRQAGLAGTATFRVLPATDVEADELLDASESVVTQLEGFRGGPRLDREALRDLVLRFAVLLRDIPEIVEADLNPVRCMPRGCTVLDTRLRIEHRRPPERVKTW
jgi:acetate---CoA ligase (ADP-forming)